MIEAIKAHVRPRVIIRGCCEPLLLEDLVASILEARDVRGILLFGARVPGTRSAIQHLGHVFGTGLRLEVTETAVESAPANCQIQTMIRFPDIDPEATQHSIYCRLAPWDHDDWIEYLLATHRSECKSVMQRVINDPQLADLQGNPFLVALVLDEMALDEDLPNVTAALRRIVDRYFPNPDQRRRIGVEFFDALREVPLFAQNWIRSVNWEDSYEHQQLMSCPPVQLILATETALEFLQQPDFHIETMWPRELIESVAAIIAGQPDVQKILIDSLVPRHWDRQPLAASLLHSAGLPFEWPKPTLFRTRSHRTNLCGAILDGADCSRFQLDGAFLQKASFKSAKLVGMNLQKAKADEACFDGADLHSANLSGLKGYLVSFARANLSGVCGRYTDFRLANLQSADLSRARFENSEFVRAELSGLNLELSEMKCCQFLSANLNGINARNARLTECDFTGAQFDDSDFQDADLSGSRFQRANLSTAKFQNTSFRDAILNRCDLEGLEIPNADFRSASLENSFLTASVMPRANFVNADLSNTGLAEIEWEGANLRNAVLTGATFHMGSSRNGLVGSTIPMLGSRTGFYTDELYEQEFKAPEEIRKANLRGVDIRGAEIDGVDFYLVDLRDSLYDDEQEEQLRRTGAILN